MLRLAKEVKTRPAKDQNETAETLNSTEKTAKKFDAELPLHFCRFLVFSFLACHNDYK